MWRYVLDEFFNHSTRTFVSFGRDREAVKWKNQFKPTLFM
jgi:hypothetical protein